MLDWLIILGSFLLLASIYWLGYNHGKLREKRNRLVKGIDRYIADKPGRT